MAILAECPQCHKKQSIRNRLCGCGADLVKLKGQKEKVKYWITYRLPGGKQRRECVGYSVNEARDAEGKRKSQKRENRIFDMLPESKMTFNELAEWYLGLKAVKKLATYDRVVTVLKNFNEVFGSRVIASIKPTELEDYQERREEQGRAHATIDMEISITKTMVTKAFDNDMVDAKTLKAFRNVKRKLRKAANARKQTVSVPDYLKLLRVSPPHLKAILTIAYNTGMRMGEIRGLRWSHIDKEKRFIRLPAELTKERKPKTIPVNHHVRAVLDSLPRALHHDHVIRYNGEPIRDRGGLKKSFTTACKNAGLVRGRSAEDGIIPHDFRRSAKTNMLNAGVNKVHRDIILGHSLGGIDVHYIVPTDEDLMKAMTLYTKWLDEEIHGIQLGQHLVNIS